MPVVTVSGHMGSGRLWVGSRVAELLGVDYVDNEIIRVAAQRMGSTEEVVARIDEKTVPWRKRAARTIETLLERSALGSAGDPFLGAGGVEILLAQVPPQPQDGGPPQLDELRAMKAMAAVIKDLGQGGNIVIVGRGGQTILRDLPGVFHAYVYAPWELRVQRVMQRAGIPRPEAEKRMKESDHQRVAYFKKFFKVDVGDPSLYHVMVNTAVTSLESTAKLVADGARLAEAEAKKGAS